MRKPTIAAAGTAADLFATFIDALAERVAEHLEIRLASRLAPNELYSSENLPPDVRTRERFHRIVKACPGAERYGRTWRVRRDAWESFRRTRLAATHAADAAVSSDVDDVDDLLAGAGLRPTRLRAVGGGRSTR